AYTAKTKGFPQTSGLLSKDDDGYSYVYFIENDMPGCVRVIKDKAGVDSLIDGVKENSDTGYAPVLFTPDGEQAQYAICSPVADEYGTLYFKNDSTHMMAVGSKIKSIEVTQKPDKTVYQQGEKFDASGIKVVVKLANGLERDITKYVKISDNELSLDDKEVKITYDIVKYGDKFDAENGNTAGVKYEPLETYVDVNVLTAEDYEKVKAVEEKIYALGEITLESENAVKDARAAFDALDENLRELVSNSDKLADAEQAIEQLKKENESSSVSDSSSEADSSSVLDSGSDADSSVIDSSSKSDNSSNSSSSPTDSSSSQTVNQSSGNNVNTGGNMGSAALVILLLACGLALAIVVVKTAKNKKDK
ncbi:MAG: bacterial Ig-like domain-containing protein, partial [Oscillospiraceae bacterium]